MSIPETYVREDWPRRVSQEARRLSSRTGFLENQTGWEYHLDSTSTISLTAGTRTQVTITPDFQIVDQSPDGLDLFAGNEVFGAVGDVIATRFTADFTPDDATASLATIEVEADVLGVIDKFDFPIITGAGVIERLSWSPLIFIGSDDVAAGVRFYITVDGPGDLTNTGFLPVRLHRGR